MLPTTGSHGSCSESSREFLPVRLVFPDAVVTSASSTKRRLYGAKRSLYRGERCVDSGANRATNVPARPTKAGRSAGGANAAVHSSGKPRVDDEDLRLQGDTGSKTGGDQSEKGNKKRAHRDTTRISRMLGTTALSARTRFSVTPASRPTSTCAPTPPLPNPDWLGCLARSVSTWFV